jgi:peptidoglycan/xylan/chitin deacetylase (PgdA/CDA1 family)
VPLVFLLLFFVPRRALRERFYLAPRLQPTIENPILACNNPHFLMTGGGLMLRTHGRYDYSNITTRPDYSWPGGKRLAVYVAINIEQFSYGEGKGAAIAPPDQANSHSIFSWRDYGNRVGVWRLFDLFDSLDIPIEAQINTAIYDHCPDIVDRLRQRGDEILGHGLTNSEEQGGLSEAEEAELIRTVTETLTRQEGQPPVGWMSPWLSNSEVTADLLQEAGYRYFMDWTSDDQPIWMKTRRGRILSIPYPIECNDTRGIVWYRYTSGEFADMLVDNFDEMLEQSAGQPLVCPISLHPFVMGRPYRIRQLRRAFEHILSYREQIWLTRPRDICAHIESLPAGVVPGS